MSQSQSKQSKVFTYISSDLKFLTIFSHLEELQDFNSRRIGFFKKNFIDLVELELKHAKVKLIEGAIHWKVMISSYHSII